MDQTPESYRKIPLGMGEFVAKPLVANPEFTQEVHRTDKTIPSREEVLSIGR